MAAMKEITLKMLDNSKSSVRTEVVCISNIFIITYFSTYLVCVYWPCRVKLFGEHVNILQVIPNRKNGETPYGNTGCAKSKSIEKPWARAKRNIPNVIAFNFKRVVFFYSVKYMYAVKWCLVVVVCVCAAIWVIVQVVK